jgi:hypothetical protein
MRLGDGISQQRGEGLTVRSRGVREQLFKLIHEQAACCTDIVKANQ